MPMEFEINKKKTKKKKPSPKGGGPLMSPGQKKMFDKQTGRGKPMEAKSGGAMKKADDVIADEAIDAYKKRTADSLAKTEKSRKLVKIGASKNFGSDLSNYTKKKKLTSRKKPKQKNVSDFAGGGSLKPVPEGNKGKGLSKLPTPVRNKMGFMKKGGKVMKMRGGGMADRGISFRMS